MVGRWLTTVVPSTIITVPSGLVVVRDAPTVYLDNQRLLFPTVNPMFTDSADRVFSRAYLQHSISVPEGLTSYLTRHVELRSVGDSGGRVSLTIVPLEMQSAAARWQDSADIHCFRACPAQKFYPE